LQERTELSTWGAWILIRCFGRQHESQLLSTR
jgi:hypothetical protein